MRETLIPYSSRKFVLVLGSGIINALLLWYGKLTPDAYSMIVIATLGAYIAGNVFQKTKEQ